MLPLSGAQFSLCTSHSLAQRLYKALLPGTPPSRTFSLPPSSAELSFCQGVSAPRQCVSLRPSLWLTPSFSRGAGAPAPSDRPPGDPDSSLGQPRATSLLQATSLFQFLLTPSFPFRHSASLVLSITPLLCLVLFFFLLSLPLFLSLALHLSSSCSFTSICLLSIITSSYFFLFLFLHLPNYLFLSFPLPSPSFPLSPHLAQVPPREKHNPLEAPARLPQLWELGSTPPWIGRPGLAPL